MNKQITQNYLRNKVMTATPEQLQMMLFDGVVRFCEQARPALAAKQYEKSFDLIAKAQKIVIELQSSLKHDIDRDLCGKLAAIYVYVYKQLVQASVKHDMGALDEAIKRLKFQRETWEMLLNQISQSKAASAAAEIDLPQPSSRMEASLNLAG